MTPLSCRSLTPPAKSYIGKTSPSSQLVVKTTFTPCAMAKSTASTACGGICPLPAPSKTIPLAPLLTEQ